jgi:hypothetical protein
MVVLLVDGWAHPATATVTSSARRVVVGVMETKLGAAMIPIQ